MALPWQLSVPRFRAPQFNKRYNESMDVARRHERGLT